MFLLERRRTPRFPFHSLGWVHVGSEKHSGTVLDLSAKGALFAAQELTDELVGKTCELSIMIASPPEFLALRGVVVNQRGDLLGLEFLEVSEAARRGLMLIVEMNLGSPDLVERDIPALLRQTHAGEVRDADTVIPL